MEKTLKKNILTLPTDSLPVRTKKAIAVTQAADGTVTNIEAVYPDGKRVDLDGNVQGTKSVTITANGTQNIVPATGYTSMKKVAANIAVAPVQMTQAQYDALETKDPNTVYVIHG